MTTISLIAAIDKKGGLGKNNQLLCHLPADLNHFRQLTLGKPVIMGRKTFLSIGKPLPQRQNIVLTTQSDKIEGVDIAHSLQEALTLVSSVKEVMIIGGSSVFKEGLAIADDLYFTIIHHEFEADIFFPAFNKSDWECKSVTERPADEKNAYDLTFYHYQRLPIFKSPSS